MRALEPSVVIVGDEEESPWPRHPTRRPSLAQCRVVGVLATVVVHLLLSSPVLLGTAAHKTPPIDGLGSVAWASQGSERESMILLDLSALSIMANDESLTPESKSEDTELRELKVVLASDDVRPPPELQIDDAEESDESNEQAGDPAGAEVLFGRYMNQIAARVERGWERPRTPVAGGRFDCQARIAQDRRGRVLSVEFQNCSEDIQWRQSLDSAIRSASPLSSPPEQWLFAENISLTFSAAQYEAGASEPHLYEPEATRLVRNAQGIEASKGLEGAGDYDLTIEGGEVRWKRKDSSSDSSE
jgi:hypothetical protein